MNIFNDKHQLLLKKFLEAGVDFILIGGYAVAYYGYKRTTGDMDLWLKPDNQNKQKLVKVLEQFHFNRKGIEHIKNLDFTKYIAFHFWKEPERVDCLTKIAGVQYEEADVLKEVVDFDGLAIPVIHYNHLITSKISSDRMKDKADVEELQKISRLKK